jgi:hypothetical protein
LHHTGSQKEIPVAVPEEQTGIDPQELQAQEVPEEEEQGEDLPKCADHQPSSFERGKPQSISLPVCKCFNNALLQLTHYV